MKPHKSEADYWALGQMYGTIAFVVIAALYLLSRLF